MRTLIRASQLHPDLSGIVTGYTSPHYPNYSDIIAGSGVTAYISGKAIVLGLESATNVSSLNGLYGEIGLRGFNGINITNTGNNIDLSITGLGTVGTLNQLSGNINLQGSGLVDIWPINYNTIAVKVDPISGIEPINVFSSGGQTIIGFSSGNDGVISTNNLGGNINISGQHGVSIYNTGQTIVVNAYAAAHSGVHAINSIKGQSVLLTGGNDIKVSNTIGNSTISIDYKGSGWGSNYIILNQSGKKNINWIGDSNIFDGDNSVFVQGSNNGFFENESCTLLNGHNSYVLKCANTAVINSNQSITSGVSGSTLINPKLTQGALLNNNSFIVGTPNQNTFYNSSLFTTKVSGFSSPAFNSLSLMKIPKTTQNYVKVGTGCVLMGQIDYVAAAYHITDFFASSNIKENGMYGRKYFTAQRTNNLEVKVRDEADLFGGIEQYNILLSGGVDDGRLYLIASGISGHDTFFMANVQYTQFNLNLLDD